MVQGWGWDESKGACRTFPRVDPRCLCPVPLLQIAFERYRLRIWPCGGCSESQLELMLRGLGGRPGGGLGGALGSGLGGDLGGGRRGGFGVGFGRKLGI